MLREKIQAIFVFKGALIFQILKLYFIAILMTNRRVTIYDLAKALEISVSYVSKTLNGHPSISESMKAKVQQKVKEMGYIHNSSAANLRRGKSKTIGVIVPHINKSIFSEAISGIEEACAEHDHSLIICQSHESYVNECKAIDLLVRQNVDCILISVSAQTSSADYLHKVRESKIDVVQFDRYVEGLDCFRVVNNDKEVSCQIVNGLLANGYHRIAFLGGPEHSMIYRLREQGYRNGLQQNGLAVSEEHIRHDVLQKQSAYDAVKSMLTGSEPPDSFVVVADQQALVVMEVVSELGLDVSQQIGVVGFANEIYTGLIKPSLSSVDQKSRQLGRRAANVYFQQLINTKIDSIPSEIIVEAEILWRDSSRRV